MSHRGPAGSAADTCSLAAQVSPRRRLLPPPDVYPVEPWRIVERRFSPRFLPQVEALFAVSNRYLGIRATPEEGLPVHERGTYLNGFHETWPIVYGEETHGFARGPFQDSERRSKLGGSGSGSPMVGGMLSATILALVILPIVYEIWRAWQLRREARNEDAVPEP